MITGGSFTGGEADHSAPTSAKERGGGGGKKKKKEKKKKRFCTCTLPYVFMACCLVKQKDNFTFIYYDIHYVAVIKLRQVTRDSTHDALRDY
jgi:hypothetical protein